MNEEIDLDVLLLPIGSVCKLMGSEHYIMITGFCPIDVVEQKIFDYSGCIWPYGQLSSRQNFLFNHSDIAEVVGMGFSNDEEKKIRRDLADAIANKKIINFTYDKDSNEIKVTKPEEKDHPTKDVDLPIEEEIKADNPIEELPLGEEIKNNDIIEELPLGEETKENNSVEESPISEENNKEQEATNDTNKEEDLYPELEVLDIHNL